LEDSEMSATLTQQPNTSEFAVIVGRLVTRARRERPELADRLERAARLATQPNCPVVFYSDGTATVRSQRGGDVTYRVDGPRCECPDHTHRQRLCVHALAAGLVRRATREARDEANRRQSYRSQYVAPGTPGAFTACNACGVIAVLNADGLCPEDAAVERWMLTPKGAQALAGVAGVA
jgi:hypothetical protein